MRTHVQKIVLYRLAQIITACNISHLLAEVAGRLPYEKANEQEGGVYEGNEATAIL